jgi:hypothetical protein
MHVVLLVHGIRDYALWQNEIAATLKDRGFIPEPLDYGRYGLLSFLLPIPLFRNFAIRTVRRQMDDVIKQYPNAEISVIAHSFGTWIIAKILQQGFNLKLHRVIFCGSVVPYYFPFEDFSERFDDSIMNEVGDRDPWPALAESMTWGYGSGGTYGFRRPRVVDRWHKGAHHGYFLNSTFCETYWVPLLRDGTIVKTAQKPRPPQLWVRGISFWRLKYSVCILLAVTWYVSTPITLLSGLHRYQQSIIRGVHKDETPVKDYPLLYPFTRGHQETVDISIFANADISIYFLGHEEWIAFRREIFNPTALVSESQLQSIVSHLVGAAYGQDMIPAQTSATPNYKRISIVSACKVFCADSHSFTFRIMANLDAEVDERDSDGKEVSASKLAIKQLSDVFAALKIPDLESGASSSNRRSAKEVTFRRAAGVPNSERLVALIDATVWGSGAKGVGFGDARIYYSGGLFYPPFSLSYFALMKSPVKAENSHTVIVGDKEIAIPGSDVDAFQLSSLLGLLKIIAYQCPVENREICRAFTADVPPSLGTPQ